MSGNSSSQLADVPLSKSEFNYQLSLNKDKKSNLAKKLSNNKRYVDDLGVINYTSFASRILEIYLEVVSFTFPHSNISIGYNLFYSQLIRYYKIYSEVQDFIHSSQKLYRELSVSRRGYSHWGLVRKFLLFIKNKSEVINKYNINDVTEIQRSIFNDC